MKKSARITTESTESGSFGDLDGDGVPLPRPRARADRREAGRSLREAVPLEAHAELGHGARDPIGLLRAQDVGRVAELVPIRWGRMSATPFTFYRGAAGAMASDLALLPRVDLPVQLCGDAHLSNFGAFAAADRRIVVDINDFDETAPGPFDWDVKRLAASVVLAGRERGLGAKACTAATLAAVQGYRTVIAKAAEMDPLSVWYHRIELDELDKRARAAGRSTDREFERVRADSSRRNQLGALAKLTEVVDGRRRIRARPPLITRFDAARLESEFARIEQFFIGYLDTLSADRRRLLDRYRVVDIAFKVVGVGSVGTRCLLAMLESGDGDALFLQIKQAVGSVLDPAPAAGANGGRRVVDGQRILQGAADPFLGWSRYEDEVETDDYYVRQLWDGKASVRLEDMNAAALTNYSRLCGFVLARAHARSGDAATIAGYLGKKDRFDRAIATFATRYADRTVEDYAVLMSEIEHGQIEAIRDI